LFSRYATDNSQAIDNILQVQLGATCIFLLIVFDLCQRKTSGRGHWFIAVDNKGSSITGITKDNPFEKI